jgi:hypothetical protein
VLAVPYYKRMAEEMCQKSPSHFVGGHTSEEALGGEVHIVQSQPLRAVRVRFDLQPLGGHQLQAVLEPFDGGEWLPVGQALEHHGVPGLRVLDRQRDGEARGTAHVLQIGIQPIVSQS